MKSAKVYNILTLLQCSPTTDGAACVILCNEKFMKKHHLEDQAVEIMAMELVTDFPTISDNHREIIGVSMTKKAA